MIGEIGVEVTLMYDVKLCKRLSTPDLILKKVYYLFQLVIIKFILLKS